MDRLLLSPDGHLLYVLSGSQLSIWRLDAGGARLRQQVALAAAGPLSLFILPAEGALLVRNGAGHLSLWFDVAGDTGPRLTPIFTYNVTLDAGARFLAPARRGGFAVLDSAGTLTLFRVRDAHPRGRLAIPGMPPPGPGIARGKFAAVSARRWACRGGNPRRCGSARLCRWRLGAASGAVAAGGGAHARRFRRMAHVDPVARRARHELAHADRKNLVSRLPSAGVGMAVHAGRRQFCRGEIQPGAVGGRNAESRFLRHAVRYPLGAGRRHV
uniref:hypothetical protein n=1 Tax=Sodalis praecaptivus TaxID=1239307 RepID=UPI00280AD825|nr:hypothetical protein [Sodalis praecaptivus]